ncbi:MAG: 16S rRNA (cytosine(1402)-N(4))-methyltransferase RsmH [Selenomonadaceae bacterium]|nr:16S rRNA (cytosine(1402)-N(4))-methyltransferase RsmH [Selenomonadaceae bacterium]
MKFEHKSVMLKEAIEILQPKPDGIYLDCTLGGGGHSLEIGKCLNSEGILIGIDQDISAVNAAKEKLSALKCRVEIVHENFSGLEKVLDGLNVEKIDGVIFDLGVSSHQIDTAERGFSYIHNAPLDMRMNQEKNFSAYNVVNEYSEEDLIKIFHEYGEERFSKKIARAVVKARPIETTGELVGIVENSVPHTKNGGHPAKRIFQAIRIEVNNELEILSKSIVSAVNRLKVGGRIAVITFHSLEDRIVKNTFKSLAQDCICPKNFPVCVCGHKAEIKILGKTKTATNDELDKNPRAKSAKLRSAEKLGGYL